jgi:hypothetical protein
VAAFRFERREFTLLSKPFEKKALAKKERLKYPESANQQPRCENQSLSVMATKKRTRRLSATR